VHLILESLDALGFTLACNTIAKGKRPHTVGT